LEQLVHERTKELENSRELLKVQATHDGLTGMLNRVAILDALTDEIERARRGAKSFVLALVDLDLFKRVNDSRGHLAGDQALRDFAAAVSKAIRPYDHSGRYGGEEFLIVMPDVPSDAAEERLVRFHESVSNLSVGRDDCEFRITCSLGAVIVSPPTEPISPEPLLAMADKALYEAKASGRNRVITKRFGQTNSLQNSLLCVPSTAGGVSLMEENQNQKV
jgi:diguanylate cyclase (GGDEF)-like protein